MLKDSAMTSQRARKALIDEVIAMYHTTRLINVPASEHILSKPSVVKAFDTIRAEALAQGRLEGAKAMQEAVIDKLDECCEPCFQCNQNVTALDPAEVVKGLNDAENQ